MLNYIITVVSIPIILLSSLSTREAYARSIVLIGGNLKDIKSANESSAAIYQKIIELSEDPEEAKVGILTTASISKSVAQEKAEKYTANFNDIGVTDVEWIPFHIENCTFEKNNQAIADLIRTKTVLFFGGGLTSSSLECFFEQRADGQFEESLITQTIRHAYDNGTVIAGNSAGAMMQTSSPLIEGGESYQALVSGALASDSQRSQGEAISSTDSFTDRQQLLRAAMSLQYSQKGGLGFFPYGPIDTHFSERGRQGSLIRFSSDTRQPLSFGIDENTALIVINSGTPDAVMSVVGDGGVSIFDLRQSKIAWVNGFWSTDDVKMSYLTQGDLFEVEDENIKFASWKTPFAERHQSEESMIPSINIFSSLEPALGRVMSLLMFRNSANTVRSILSDRPDAREFIATAFSLLKSSKTSISGRTFESDPVTYRVTLSKDVSQGSQGLVGTNRLGEEIISFQNLIIQITPEIDANRSNSSLTRSWYKK